MDFIISNCNLDIFWNKINPTMSLIDKYLPKYDYNEVHRIIVNESLENCYNCAMELE